MSNRLRAKTLLISLICTVVLSGFSFMPATPFSAVSIAHAASNAYCIDDGSGIGTVRIGNTGVEIVVERTSGYFRDIRNKLVNGLAGFHFKSFSGGDWPYLVQVGTDQSPIQSSAGIVPAASAHPQVISSFSCTSGANSASLTVNYSNLVNNANGAATSIALSYTVVVKDAPGTAVIDQNEYFSITATVTNNNTAPSGKKVTGLYAGVGGQLIADGTTGWTSGGSHDGSRSAEILSIPDWRGGTKIANPQSAYSSAPATYGFPGWSTQTLTMGWIDLWSPGSSSSNTAKGLGMGYVNKEGMVMNFKVGQSGSGSFIQWQQFDLTESVAEITGPDDNSADYYGLEPGNSWTTGHWIIAPHSGDWHTLADAYRNVYNTDMAGNFLTESDYPADFKDVWYSTIIYGSLADYSGRVEPLWVGFPASTIRSTIASYTSLNGSSESNYSVMMSGYSGNGTIGGAEYGFPAYSSLGNKAGSAVDVQNALNDLATDGVPYAGIYMNTLENAWTADTIQAGSYKPNAANGNSMLQSTQMGDNYEAEASGNTFTSTSASTCAACESAQDVVLGTSSALKFNNVTGNTTAPYSNAHGSYNLRIYYLNGGASDATASVSVNGGTAVTYSFAKQPNWQLVPFKDISINLNPNSSNTIQLSNASATLSIDKIMVMPADFGANYEAEAALNTLSGTAAAAICAACSNGHDVTGLGSGTGNSLKISGINVNATQPYRIMITYVGDGSAHTANNVVVAGNTMSVAFPAVATGTLGTVTLTTTGNLTKGRSNSVPGNDVLISSSTSLPAIDKITVQPLVGGYISEADSDTADWQSTFADMAPIMRGYNSSLAFFDQQPLIGGISKLTTGHLDGGSDVVSRLEAEVKGKRRILNNYWNSTDPTHPTAFKPFIETESGNDVMSGYSVFWNSYGIRLYNGCHVYRWGLYSLYFP